MHSFTVAHPYTPDVLYYLDKADEAKAQQRFLDAVQYAEKAFAQDMTCFDALEEIADNYISLEEYAKAEKALLHAKSLGDASANMYFLFGFLQIKSGAYAEAVVSLSQANTLFPNHGEVLRNLGWAYYNSGQHTRGIVLLERALNLVPEDTYVMCDLGICYINEKNFDRAIALFEQALIVEPENEKFVECMRTAEYFKSAFQKYTQ